MNSLMLMSILIIIIWRVAPPCWEICSDTVKFLQKKLYKRRATFMEHARIKRQKLQVQEQLELIAKAHRMHENSASRQKLDAHLRLLGAAARELAKDVGNRQALQNADIALDNLNRDSSNNPNLLEEKNIQTTLKAILSLVETVNGFDKVILQRVKGFVI